jgi:UDP-N-acetyl-D-glucosamine/UDP-N-acetyl-D-galactosamine dehydrogenase
MTTLAIGQVKIATIGLGYVGLPLAVHLSHHFPVTGFDINEERIAELRGGHDRTRELTREELQSATRLSFTSSPDDLQGSNFFIVTVPTPIDLARRPDLEPLRQASRIIGRNIKPGGIVVYESTVYPGVTEDVCVPIIEQTSGLVFNQGFFAGYSPERINPADPNHGLAQVKKVVSGSSPRTLQLVDDVYGRVVTAGTHRASSIRVAEAAKVIENIQRDVNIALTNEFAQLFKRMGLETREVLEAAGTKWNFHYYRPGLVGGHCIGVDPYYLTHKAQEIGFHPEMILAGRRINDGMAAFVAQDVVKTMLKKKLNAEGARILVLGATFKQNCPDVRNSKVFDLVRELEAFGHPVTIHDPLAIPDEVKREFDADIETAMPDGPFEAAVIAVRHDVFAAMGETRLRALLVPGGLLYDLKEALPIAASDARL